MTFARHRMPTTRRRRTKPSFTVSLDHYSHKPKRKRRGEGSTLAEGLIRSMCTNRMYLMGPFFHSGSSQCNCPNLRRRTINDVNSTSGLLIAKSTYIVVPSTNAGQTHEEQVR